jgi:hypothetical protein
MRAGLALALAVSSGLSVPVVSVSVERAEAYEVEHYYVYCADDRIEVSFWDLEQMMVRRGSDVCQFMTYTSYSDALKFAEKNFGGEGRPCSC